MFHKWNFYLLFAAISFVLSGCTSQYHVYSVENSHIESRVSLPPPVSKTPVLQHTDFNIYGGSSNNRSLYLVPTSLYLARSHFRQHQAMSFEHRYGEHQIFIAHMSPKANILVNANAALKEGGIEYDSLVLYPVDIIKIIPVTDPRSPESISVTTISGQPTQHFPYSVLIGIQVNGKDNILSFKKLIESNFGYILEGNIDLLFSKNSNDSDVVSIQIVLRDAYATNQTM